MAAAGAAGEAYAPVPFFWSDQAKHRIQFIGRSATGDDDTVRVMVGSPDEQRFLALYGRRGRLWGALGVNAVRLVMPYRALLADAASWDDAARAGRVAAPGRTVLDGHHGGGELAEAIEVDAFDRKVRDDPVVVVAVAIANARGQLLERAPQGEVIEHLVIDEPGDLVPSSLLHQLFELGLQVDVSDGIEDVAVHRARCVERDLAADPRRRRVLLLVGVAHREQEIAEDPDVVAVAAGARQPGLQRRDGDALLVGDVGEGVRHVEVGDFAGQRGIRGPTPPSPIGMWGHSIGPGLNIGCRSVWE